MTGKEQEQEIQDETPDPKKSGRIVINGNITRDLESALETALSMRRVEEYSFYLDDRGYDNGIDMRIYELSGGALAIAYTHQLYTHYVNMGEFDEKTYYQGDILQARIALFGSTEFIIEKHGIIERIVQKLGLEGIPAKMCWNFMAKLHESYNRKKPLITSGYIKKRTQRGATWPGE